MRKLGGLISTLYLKFSNFIPKPTIIGDLSPLSKSSIKIFAMIDLLKHSNLKFSPLLIHPRILLWSHTKQMVSFLLQVIDKISLQNKNGKVKSFIENIMEFSNGIWWWWLSCVAISMWPSKLDLFCQWPSFPSLFLSTPRCFEILLRGYSSAFLPPSRNIFKIDLKLVLDVALVSQIIQNWLNVISKLYFFETVPFGAYERSGRNIKMSILWFVSEDPEMMEGLYLYFWTFLKKLDKYNLKMNYKKTNSEKFHDILRNFTFEQLWKTETVTKPDLIQIIFKV